MLRYTLLERKTSLVSASLGLAVLALLFVYTYTTVTERFSNIQAFAERVPSAFESVLGDLSVIGTPAGWLGFELFELLFPLVTIILGILTGASALGDEEEQGTLDLVLATPTPRAHIIGAKMTAVTLYLAGISFGVWFGTFLGTLLADFDVDLVNVAFATMAGWLLSLTFALFTFSMQALIGNKQIALGLGAGVAFVTYFGNVLIDLSGKFEMARYLSPFHYYTPHEILLSGPANSGYLFFLATIIICVGIALLGFQYRDVQT
jgi:ABC-2 type transport system permease protein